MSTPTTKFLTIWSSLSRGAWVVAAVRWSATPNRSRANFWMA
jgi:hypothetical protein